MEPIQEVRMKNGQFMNYLKVDGKHYFFNNLLALSNWQLWILIFIILLSILMSVVQISTIVEVGNRILQTIAELKPLPLATP